MLFFLGICAGAPASIVSTSGAVVVVDDPPADISSNQWQSNTEIRAFAEQQGFTLPVDVTVDITNPGTSPSTTDSNLSPGTIPPGTVVDSYTLHFDVVGSHKNTLEATGSITFYEPVFGLLVLSDSENATNSLLGLPGVTYSDGGDHGLELDPSGGGSSDTITLSADRETVTVDLNDGYFADDIRIVTAAAPTPEPGSSLLLATAGLIPLFARGRTREANSNSWRNERELPRWLVKICWLSPTSGLCVGRFSSRVSVDAKHTSGMHLTSARVNKRLPSR